MIPPGFVDQLLARIDIVDLIERYVPLKKGGQNYMACCPFHNEKSPSFTVSPVKQFYHCFGCGAHGTAIGFLMEYAGMSFRDAVKDLAGQVGLAIPEESPTTSPADYARQQSLNDVMSSAMRHYREQLKLAPNAIEYLKQRGLTGEIAARFGIGYASDDWQSLRQVFAARYEDDALIEAGLVIKNETGRRYDRFRERVMFPILDTRGNVIGFGGRIIGQGEPKYLNSPETPLFQKGSELYGLFQARQSIRESGTVVVVEGYMDVVALAQFGFGAAVATLGTATTPIHLQKLFRQADRVVFCFDGDNAGRKAARRALENALEQLADDKSVAFLFLPTEHDPDSFIRENGLEAFRRALAEATPLTEVLLRELRQGIDLTHGEGRAQLIAQAKELVPRVAAPVLRLQIIKDLARDTGLESHEVEQALGLRSSANPRKAAPRAAPRSAVVTPLRQLLRLIAAHPKLIGKLPGDLFAKLDESADRAALAALHDMHDDGGLETSSFAAIYERFRDSELESVFADLLTGLDEEIYPEETADSVLADLLAQLSTSEIEREWEFLHQAIKAGTANAEQQQRYLALLPLLGQRRRPRQAG